MRVCLLALLAAAFICGCSDSGPTNPSTTAPGSAPGFGLPTPADLDMLAVDQHSYAAGPDHRSTSRLAHAPGNSFPDWLPHHNADVDDINYTVTLQGTQPGLAYCVYRIDAATLGPGQELTALLLQLEWLGSVPTGAEGIWVGFADFSANTWTWLDPIVEQDEWLDLTAAGLQGRAGNSYLAVVNYSAVDVKLLAVSYQFTHADQFQGDEWIYFTHFNPDEPSFKTSISRVKPDGSVTEPLLTGDADLGYSEPRVVRIQGGDPRLVFRFSAPTEDRMGTVDPELGGVPTWLRGAFAGLIPGGWDPTGAVYLWMEVGGFGYYNLSADNLDLPESGRLSRDIDDIREAEWDTSFTGGTYSAICTKVADLPVPRTIIATFHANGPLPADSTPVALIDNGSETAQNPAPFSLWTGLGDMSNGLLFASKDRDDATFNLYFWLESDLPVADAIQPLLVDPAYDLTNPVLAPDGLTVAFIIRAPGADRGTLYTMDFLTGNLDSATSLATGVTGKLSWYDPTP